MLSSHLWTNIGPSAGSAKPGWLKLSPPRTIASAFLFAPPSGAGGKMLL